MFKQIVSISILLLSVLFYTPSIAAAHERTDMNNMGELYTNCKSNPTYTFCDVRKPVCSVRTWSDLIEEFGEPYQQGVMAHRNHGDIIWGQFALDDEEHEYYIFARMKESGELCLIAMGHKNPQGEKL